MGSSYATEQLFCGMVSTEGYVNTCETDHEWPVVFYGNVALCGKMLMLL